MDCVDFPKQTNLEQKFLSLKNVIEKKNKNSEYERLEELNNVNKKLESECDKLKQGLAAAWSQCTKLKEKYQTLSMNDSKYGSSSLEQTFATSSFEVYHILDRQLGFDRVRKKLER